MLIVPLLLQICSFIQGAGMRAWRCLRKLLHAEKWRLFYCSSLMPATKHIWVKTRSNSYISASKRKILKKLWWVLQFPWGMNFTLWDWLKHTRQVSFIPRVLVFFLNISLFLHLAPPLCNNSLLLINPRTSNSRRDVVHSSFSLKLHLCPVQSGAEGVVASFIQSSSALFFTN